MSGTTTPPPDQTSLAVRVMEWSRPAIGISTIGAYVAGFVLSYRSSNQQLFTVMATAAVTNLATVVGFYFGSSSGSEKKDNTLAAMATREPPK